MTCHRCQGLIVDDAGDVRCLNCGHRLVSAYVPPLDERMNAERAAQADDDVLNWKLSIRFRKTRGKDKQKRKTHA